MRELGKTIGAACTGGESIELVGDVGAGKTTLTKGIAAGLGVTVDVQSPTFTISRTYDGRDNLRLVHYDFYRLNDAGIMANELAEEVGQPDTVVVIEWAEIIHGVLPEGHPQVFITAPSEHERTVRIKGLSL